MNGYWEDVAIGEKLDLGTHTFTEDEIMEFARRYDPQSFHVDREAAARSMYGGIIASGWHTTAVWMKLMVTALQKTAAQSGERLHSGVSPGFENLRWLKPVRPGMTLACSAEIVDKRLLESMPEWGLVVSRNEARAADGAPVMSFTGKAFIRRKHTGETQ